MSKRFFQLPTERKLETMLDENAKCAASSVALAAGSCCWLRLALHPPLHVSCAWRHTSLACLYKTCNSIKRHPPLTQITQMPRIHTLCTCSCCPSVLQSFTVCPRWEGCPPLRRCVTSSCLHLALSSQKTTRANGNHPTAGATRQWRSRRWTRPTRRRQTRRSAFSWARTWAWTTRTRRCRCTAPTSGPPRRATCPASRHP